MSAEIYRALHFINQASEDMVKQIEYLRDVGVLTPHFSEIRILSAKQNCAEIAASAVHRLTQAELDTASKLEKERAEKEQALAKDECSRPSVKSQEITANF
jgi:hypothetical protein